MSQEKRFDLVVVGTGVIGQSALVEIVDRDPSLSAALVGPGGSIGAGSWAAGAMLDCFAEVTKYTLAHPASRERLELGQRALDAWPAWLDRLNNGAPGQPIKMGEGTFVIENGRSGFLDSQNYAAVLEALQEYDEPYSEVEPAEVPGMNPVPDARALRAVFLPREGCVDSHAVLARLSGLIDQSPGVTTLEGHVESLVVRKDGVRGVRLRDGTILHADVVVVAAGAFSGPLFSPLVEAGGLQPVLAGSGVAFVSRRTCGAGFSHVVRSVNRAGSCGLHVVPYGNEIEYVGATNVIFREPETLTHAGVCHFLTECAMEQLDQAIAYSRILEWRIGNRPVTLDTFPLLGWGPLPGLYVLTGTYRDGFHTSPVLADLCATEILEGRRPFARTFEATRRPISTMSVERSIDEFVLHEVSSSFESAMRIPRFWDSRDLGRMFRPLGERVYEELGIDWGLPPDIVTYLAVSRKDPGDVADMRRYLSAMATYEVPAAGPPVTQAPDDARGLQLSLGGAPAGRRRRRRALQPDGDAH